MGTERTHPIPTDGADPAADALRYEAVLKSRWPEHAAPPFDLLLLGLGRDGHTASLFPGGPALKETRLWAAAALAPTGQQRITLTLPGLAGARTTVFLAVGVDKAEAVRAALCGDDACPAGMVARAGAQPLWLLDEAAASRL